MTRAELRGLIRLTVGDAGRWPDATLDAWIAAGIGFYGAHFGERAMPATDADVIDAPAIHLEALTAYVEHAVALAMQMAAANESDGSSITVSQLGDQTRRAWNRYKDVMDQLLAMSAGAAERVRWGVE